MATYEENLKTELGLLRRARKMFDNVDAEVRTRVLAAITLTYAAPATSAEHKAKAP